MLIRALDEVHSVCVSRSFPKILRYKSSHKHRVIIGIGGNIGDTRRRLEHLWVYLGRLKMVHRLQSGVILRNPPFGYTEQPNFDNTVIEVATSLNPRAFLRLLWRVEKRFGRQRSFPNAPRTLDLDILFFDERKIRSPELNVPHLSWCERPSVLIPLKSMGQKVRRRYETFDI